MFSQLLNLYQYSNNLYNLLNTIILILGSGKNLFKKKKNKFLNHTLFFIFSAYQSVKKDIFLTKKYRLVIDV
jgi:hypothetical protein